MITETVIDSDTSALIQREARMDGLSFDAALVQLITEAATRREESRRTIVNDAQGKKAAHYAAWLAERESELPVEEKDDPYLAYKDHQEWGG